MKKGVLLILDGYGEGEAGMYNAVINANTPTLDKIKSKGYALLKTHGESVGLFESEMGGSEVGHLTIGSGRVVNTIAKQIRDEIRSGEFRKNKVINHIADKLSANGGNLHLIGLMSDKNVHSNIEHCIEVIKHLHKKVKNIYVHFISDGRDSGIADSIKYLELLNSTIKDIPNCEILSVGGRFYGMDRERLLDRTEKAFDAMFNKVNEIDDVESYLKLNHANNVTDENIVPVSVKSSTYNKVSENDVVFFFNFREDRMRQIAKRCEKLNCEIVTMSNVGGVNSLVAYPKTTTTNTLSEYLSEHGLKQIKITETTKYAHLTYFLNGGEEKPFPNEDRICFETIETDNYAKTPKMRAEDITEEVVLSIEKGYDAVIINFPNPDIVGHMGDYDAVVTAIECLDKCVEKIINKATEKGYFVIVTADHGNAESMVRENGEPNMSHTINKVFCAVIDNGENLPVVKEGELKNVAPTFVEMMQLKQSPYFEGKSLLI